MSKNHVANSRRAWSSTGALGLPTGSSAQRPNPAQNGDLRHNSATDRVESYFAGSWRDWGTPSPTSGTTAQSYDEKYIYTGTTSIGTTPTELLSSGVRISVPSDSSALLDLHVVGTTTVTGNSGSAFKVACMIINDGGAASILAAYPHMTQDVAKHVTTTDVDISTSGASIVLKVIGDAGAAMRWTAVANLVICKVS